MATGAFSFNRFFIRCCSCICIVLVACGQFLTPSAPVSGLPTCIPPGREVNPYVSPLQPTVTDIYRDYRVNSNYLGLDQQRAFSRLAQSVQQSSDYRNFAVDDKQMVRITITYMNPVLIQYILLNDALAKRDNNDINGFENNVRQTMKGLAERQELLFVITITAAHYEPQAYGSSLLTVRLPVEGLRLYNSGTINVLPTHYDHNLDENIIISSGPAFGVVGYPISVGNQDKCTELMDQWTTSLTLDAETVKVAAIDSGSQFWKIRYTPLAQDNIQSTINDAFPTPGTAISRADQPPTPTWHPGSGADTTDWTRYWEDTGRYLWKIFFTDINR